MEESKFENVKFPWEDLDRRQSILLKAIPQQMTFMTSQDLHPVWSEWIKTEGYKQTVDNLQMTQKDIDEYKRMWNYILDEMVQVAQKHMRRQI